MSLLSVIAVSVLPTQAAAAPPIPEFEPFEQSPGAVSEELQPVADAINAMIARSPDRFAGVSIEGDGLIAVALPEGPNFQSRVNEARQAADTAEARSRGVSFRFSRTAISLSAMQTIKDSILGRLTAGEFEDQVVGVGLAPSRGLVNVYATDRSDDARARIKAEFGDVVVFRPIDPPQLVELDRSRDTMPHYGGSGVRMWNSSHTGTYKGPCSTAFPVERNGTRYLLTAGHCVPGQAARKFLWASDFTAAYEIPATSYYFGSLYTTTLNGDYGATTDGTQDRFGDWSLIQGSTYSPSVYSCPHVEGTCSSLYVGATHWGTPVAGTGVCTSGINTGQTCRQFIVDPDWSGYIEGEYYVHQAQVRSDQNLDGVYDCETVVTGDSGGAVYNSISGRAGYVRALGIIGWQAGCTSGYTRLSGVRAWDSSITMPTL